MTVLKRKGQQKNKLLRNSKLDKLLNGGLEELDRQTGKRQTGRQKKRHVCVCDELFFLVETKTSKHACNSL